METFWNVFEMMHLEGAQLNVITFVSMLTVCGSMQHWLISGYVEHGNGDEALKLYERMQL